MGDLSAWYEFLGRCWPKTGIENESSNESRNEAHSREKYCNENRVVSF